MKFTFLALVAALALALPAAAAAPNDTHYGLQWSLDQINAPEAWAASTGAGRVIAIVDSGVDLGHPDLAGKLVPGATFSGCANQPNGCGNGTGRAATQTTRPRRTERTSPESRRQRPATAQALRARRPTRN